MGMGDHIICNGLIRKLINPSEEYSIFVKQHNLGNVEHMFSDLPNMKYIVGDDAQVHQFIRSNGLKRSDVIMIGFDGLDKTKSFDESFYHQHKVDFNEKWDSFYSPRNLEREKRLAECFGELGDYIFVHDDERYRISLDKLPKDVKIIKPVIGLTKNMFNYAYLIENALEVHCIESSFGFMCDNMALSKNLYYHRYARTLPNSFETPVYRNFKHIIL